MNRWKGVALADRFWARVDRRGADECWNWIGRTWVGRGAGKSRGRLQVAGKHVLAPRVAWALEVGPIPNGLLVLHHCDNPACVNPAHLYLGTYADNQRDAVARGLHRSPRLRGERHPMAKLRDEQAREIHDRYLAGGITQQRLADEFGVALMTVNSIVNERRFAHLFEAHPANDRRRTRRAA